MLSSSATLSHLTRIWVAGRFFLTNLLSRMLSGGNRTWPTSECTLGRVITVVWVPILAFNWKIWNVEWILNIREVLMCKLLHQLWQWFEKDQKIQLITSGSCEISKGVFCKIEAWYTPNLQLNKSCQSFSCWPEQSFSLEPF